MGEASLCEAPTFSFAFMKTRICIRNAWSTRKNLHIHVSLHRRIEFVRASVRPNMYPMYVTIASNGCDSIRTRRDVLDLD